MSKKVTLIVALLALAVFAFVSCAKKEETAEMWKPEKPIQIIVPWGAGGSTDQMTRVVAGDLEDHLGQKIVVVNQPGASGSVGTKNALDAPHDGYTWAAGAAADLGAYKIRGLIDTTLDDWVLYLTVANVSVMAVNVDTPYQDFGELLQAFKDNPGQIPVATAGQLSAGHNAMIAIQKYTNIKYKHVTYDGGNPAVIATVAGECVAVPQLAVEEADMLAGGKLRALAVLDNRLDPRFRAGSELLRHLDSQGCAQGSHRHLRQALGRRNEELRGSEEVRCQPRRGVRSLLGCRSSEEGNALSVNHRLEPAGRGPDRDVSRGGGYPQAVAAPSGFAAPENLQGHLSIGGGALFIIPLIL
jgi:tripartite-type tricarboxylate transporter receptor subunit TctC